MPYEFPEGLAKQIAQRFSAIGLPADTPKDTPPDVWRGFFAGRQVLVVTHVTEGLTIVDWIDLDKIDD